MNIRKLCFVTSLAALIAMPALAEPHGWGDRGHHGNRSDRDNRDYGRNYGHGRSHFNGYDRRHEERTNFQIFLGSGFGNGFGHGPHYRPVRTSYRDHYYNRSNIILFGPLFGGNTGQFMTAYDQGYAANVFESTPSQQTVAWQNPDAGTAYQVTPVRTYQINNGQYCREYQAAVRIGGREQRSFGTACRTPDGAWQIMN